MLFFGFLSLYWDDQNIYIKFHLKILVWLLFGISDKVSVMLTEPLDTPDCQSDKSEIAAAACYCHLPLVSQNWVSKMIKNQQSFRWGMENYCHCE